MPDPEAPDAVALLWRRYKADGEPEARDRLILHYSPLVKFAAGRVASGLPQSVEQADLVSYGVFGLMDAIEKFEPERGFKFETYAITRIRGAIIDELRSFDWVPRSVRAKARRVEQAYSRLTGELQRTPEDHEVAAALDLTGAEFAHVMSQVSYTGLVALDELVAAAGGDRGGATVGDTVADDSADPTARYEAEETRSVLAAVIARLPEREQLVLRLYYDESMTLAEIGGVLGVTESRVCQIHTKAILALRGRLTNRVD